jgi:hypothetical protein
MTEKAVCVLVLKIIYVHLLFSLQRNNINMRNKTPVRSYIGEPKIDK